jgi:hypothetical protein
MTYIGVPKDKPIGLDMKDFMMETEMKSDD